MGAGSEHDFASADVVVGLAGLGGGGGGLVVVVALEDLDQVHVVQGKGGAALPEGDVAAAG